MRRTLPPIETMYEALLRRDSEFNGVFFVAVKTTGIFCRPVCSAKKPRFENVRFFASTQECLAAGYRACKRCQPLEVAGAMPDWLVRLLAQVEQDPFRRWTNREIADMGVEPVRACRWFTHHHGMTFQRFLRIRRLTAALQQLSIGDDIDQVAFNAGYESLSGFREAFHRAFGMTPGTAQHEESPAMVNRIPTPLGPMVVIANENELLLLEFADRRMLETQIRRLATRRAIRFSPGENAIIEKASLQLNEYFEGRRTKFELPIGLYGTQFQLDVWSKLLEIPFGETTSYDKIADSIGKPNAQRAVGRANGDNRLAIVVPCHRVIRQDGALSGYGGSVWCKEWLLDLEQKSNRGV